MRHIFSHYGVSGWEKVWEGRDLRELLEFVTIETEHDSTYIIFLRCLKNSNNPHPSTVGQNPHVTVCVGRGWINNTVSELVTRFQECSDKVY